LPGYPKINPVRKRFSNGVNRIIDANLNRLKEGLRVCEEITRFVIESPELTAGFKKIRHGVDLAAKKLPAKVALLAERDSRKDVGKNIRLNELERKNCQDIFFANIQRAKESARVLEEFAKLINKNIALRLKKIRYNLYEIEKKAAGKVSSLYYHR